MEYAKPWLALDEQMAKLASRGVLVGETSRASDILRQVGYYRLTGYLYPFRRSEEVTDGTGRARRRILDTYREGTRLDDAAAVIDFDRELRLLVLEGVDRFEVALRMQVGYVLGRSSPFAHEDPSVFTPGFTTAVQPDGGSGSSRHDEWLARASARISKSDEAFVRHFREKYDGRMPIWALTEVLEFGQVSRLYSGLRNDLATEVAAAFTVPTKRIFESWTATLNYVRNVAAHHARLFNRKLVTAPKRPRPEAIPRLAHLSHREAPKQFGAYNAFAVLAYLVRAIDARTDWPERMGRHLRDFPTNAYVGPESMGIAPGWLDEPLWRACQDERGGSRGRAPEGTTVSHTASAQLQAMIDRAGTLSDQEIETMGTSWKSDEGIVFPPQYGAGINGYVERPVVTNMDLVAAWEHALDAAGKAGRVDEIEAAREAGRAVKRDERHSHDDASAKDGAEEAVRSAVLAVGVRDLLADDEYHVLTAAWRHALGDSGL